MKSSMNLAMGMALTLGLFACGQSAQKVAAEPTLDSSLVEAPVSTTKIQDLTAESQNLIGEISKVKKAVANTQDLIHQHPENASALNTQLDDLNQQLQALKKTYAENQEALSDAEGYQMLLQFVFEHQVTALEQLPQKFQDAKTELQKQIDEIKGQQEAFQAKVEDSVETLTEAKATLKNTERMLKEKAATLKVKQSLTEEEQGQLDSIQSYLESSKQLATAKKEMAAAQASLEFHQAAIDVSMKLKTELQTRKSNLMKQLLEVPAYDSAARDVILQRIEAIQDQLTEIGVAIYDHQSALDAGKALVADNEKAVGELQAKIDGMAANLSSISGTDITADMTKYMDAEREFQALQVDYQKWYQSLEEAEMALAHLSQLEAFFAQKYPDIKPSEPTQPTEPQS